MILKTKILKKVKMEARKKVPLRRNQGLPQRHHPIMTKAGNKVHLANQKPGTVHLMERNRVSVRSFQPSLLILKRELICLPVEAHTSLLNNKTLENPQARKTSRLANEGSFGTSMVARPLLKSSCTKLMAHSAWA
jgi:hypothetical protein